MKVAVRRAAIFAPVVAVAGAVIATTQASDGGSVALGAAIRPPGSGRTIPAAKTPPSKTAPAHPARKSRPRHAPSPKPKASTLSCTGTTGMLPANYGAIVRFLTTHGYTKMAAAGIAGNIYQESKGNPESIGSGGGGLIGFTPLPAGYVTGNPAADLHTQLDAILTYNRQWAQYIPALNAAATPAGAAYIYMSDFERPGIPAAYNREAAASAVAAACGF